MLSKILKEAVENHDKKKISAEMLKEEIRKVIKIIDNDKDVK